MAFDPKRYPPDWKNISLRIKERAGWKCEICGAPHGAYILRSTEDPEKYLIYDEAKDRFYFPNGRMLQVPLSEMPEEYAGRDKFTRVVLTVHHVGIDKPDGTVGDRHDKMDVRDENLLALCQRCHFMADLDIHIVEARKSRLEHKRARIAAAGQLELF